MLVGIHIDPNNGRTKELQRYATILEFNGIPYQWLDASGQDFWSSVSKVNLFIFHWTGTALQAQMAPTIIPVVEKEMGVKCFPDMATCWSYDDKVREYYLLAQHGFPVIPTWVFWNRADALQWIAEAEYPIVFKLASGAKSMNVALVKTPGAARRLVRNMFGPGVKSENVPGLGSLKWKEPAKNIRHAGSRFMRRLRGEDTAPYERLHKGYILFQKFLPDNAVDTRVTVIGERAFIAQRFVRKNDFRASGSGMDKITRDVFDAEMISTAFAISKKMKFQMMSYDFLIDQDQKRLISEISYTSPDWTVWSVPGHRNEKMEWFEGHFWPQYCVLSDLLGLPDLKQPQMEK